MDYQNYSNTICACVQSTTVGVNVQYVCAAHDCGVYVIAITEHLCHQLLTSYRPYGHGKRRDSEETDSLAYSLTPERITQTRHELRELINTLAAASTKH
jgi:hypothetical protein